MRRTDDELEGGHLEPEDRAGYLGSRLRGPWLSTFLGVWLGVAGILLAVTGFVSHWARTETGPFPWPTRPVGLYRVTQSLHVFLGVATVIVLLAKLWAAYPRLFQYPSVRNTAHWLERIGVFLLVGAALFQFSAGVLNFQFDFSFGFDFVRGHFWGGVLFLAALLLHVVTKWAITRRELRRTGAELRSELVPQGSLVSRRGFLAVVGLGSLVTMLASVGSTVTPLRRLAVLAPRRSGIAGGGPLDFPVVSSYAQKRPLLDNWRLRVTGRVARPLELTLEQVKALPQTTVTLPIQCVLGWSASPTWTGVRLRDLLELAGVEPGRDLVVRSAQGLRGGRPLGFPLDPAKARDPLSLLALKANGADLDLDHGWPARLIVPNLPGERQAKWVIVIEVR